MKDTHICEKKQCHGCHKEYCDCEKKIFGHNGNEFLICPSCGTLNYHIIETETVKDGVTFHLRKTITN